MPRPSSGVAEVAVTWVDETGTARQGRVKLAAQGLPVGWAVELLAAGATEAGMVVATDKVEVAQVPQVRTRPAAGKKVPPKDRIQLRTINDGKGQSDV